MNAVFRYIMVVVLMGGALAQAGEFSAYLENPVTPFHRPSELRVVYKGDAGTLLDVRELERSLKALEQVEVGRRDLGTVSLPDGRLQQGVAFKLDPIMPGTHVLPAALVRAGEDEMRLPPLVWRVRDLTPAELDAVGEFMAIAMPDAAAYASGGRVWWYAALLALVAVAAALWWWLRNSKPEAAIPAPPAWEVAHRRLKELASRKLPEQGRYERYYVDLSAILRYYIEDRIGVHAPEQTTPEFLDAASGTLDETHQKNLAEFLRHCDRVKFARYEPNMNEMQRSFEIVKGFVEHTTPRMEEDREAVAGGEAAA